MNNLKSNDSTRCLLLCFIFLVGHSLTTYGQDALSISNNGNVGIGIANPSVKLDVNGPIKATNVQMNSLMVESEYTLGSAFNGWSADSRKFISFERKYKNDNGRGRTYLFAPTNYYTNVPVITLLGNYGAGGQVGIGTKEPNSILDVNGTTTTKNLNLVDNNGKVILKMNGQNQNILPEQGTYFRLGSASNAVQDIYCRFTYFSSNYKPSDVTLKKNIVPLNSKLDASHIVSKLMPVVFDWKDDSKNPNSIVPQGGNTSEIGFLAQDVAELLPDAVVKMEGTGKLAVNYEVLYTVMFEAVRAQQKNIGSLENENQKMEDELDELREEMKELKKLVLSLNPKHSSSN